MGAPSVKIVKKKTVTFVAISGSMTIENAGELRSALLKAFGIGKKIELSMVEVTDVDVTGLQLLCSCHRTSILRGLGFSIVDAVGDRFSQVAELAGMLRNTGCDRDVDGTCIWKQEV